MEAWWRVLKRSKPWHSDDFLRAAHRMAQATDALRDATDWKRHTWEEVAPLWTEFKDAVMATRQYDRNGQLYSDSGEEPSLWDMQEMERLERVFRGVETEAEKKGELDNLPTGAENDVQDFNSLWHFVFNPSMIDDDLSAGRAWGEQQAGVE